MGEGFELVIWGGFLAMLWLRGLAKKAKQAKAREALEGNDTQEALVPGGPSAAPANVKSRPSLRDQWAQMARQIEQQVEAQREAGQPTLVSPDEDEEERTLVIPGRRVIPAPTREPGQSSAPRSTAVANRGRAEIEADWGRTELARRYAEGVRPVRTVEPTPVSAKRRRPSRDATGLLDRLEHYSPIRRAMILSELLGPPLATKDDRPLRD